jgi:hypothetical protein
MGARRGVATGKGRGLTLIRSAVVDKGVGREHLRPERFDVWAGAVLAGAP